MQSSSELFPVTLVSAELRRETTEDVYLLKPNNSRDSSVELAVTRLGRLGREQQRGVPVILLHGSFSNRRFWYSPRGIGLGPYLVEAGFDVWIAEMRGHGLSPRNQDYTRNRVADYARYDLPAIGAFVREQTGQTPHWLGHSLGGITLAAALGGGYLDEELAASVALFGAQVSQGHWALKIPPLAWICRLLLKRLGGLSGPRWKRGPEDEPLGVVVESLRWHSLFGRFGEADSDWWAGLGKVRLPVLAIAGEGDRQDPAWACRKLAEQFSGPRHYLCLGTSAGFSQDYGHVDMLVSRQAQEEVWPLAEQWLRQGELANAHALERPIA
ncbi:alpha/beta fold hydrolase [Pseudomonas sp. RIT-PI-AD]|uniref:alpha/beta fold hydrolase n=1 Tax=Pseudomonas sp. RIT-PI-AD TaxID=3035294 RepID=UPI0021D88E6A|nr:alpha/beta fold hydrolase [Pseudomonas sp. RIT-PI-AD]